MAFSDDGSYIPDQPATIMGPGGSLSPEEEQDPLFKFRTPEWKNLARSEPARAYLQFQRAMIKHPDWQKMDYAGKQKVAKALTGFDPYEIIKSEGFGALNPNDRADLFNLTMDGNPDWEQLPREARLYLRSITPGLEHYSPGAQDALRRKQNEAVGRATAEKMAEVKAIEDDAEKKEFVTQRAKEVSDLYDIMGDIDFLGGTTIDRMQKFNKWAETSTMWQGIEDLEEKRRFREDIIHNSKLPAPYRENAIQQGPEGAWEMALNLKKRVELNIKRDWTALMAQHTMQDDPEYVKEQARINDELKATPYHEATGRISDGVAETGDFWAWLKGTHDVKDSLIWAAEIGLESMGQYAGTGLPLTAAAGAIATLTGGAATPLVAGGAAAGSFVMEFAPSFYDSLEKQGVDITDPDALMKALKNPTLMKNARNYATKRGMSVAGFDMLGVLLIGRLGSIRGSLKAAGRLGTIKQGLKEVGVGAVTGMLGEAGAQYWTEHGIVDPLGIFAEGFLEVPTSIVESTATRSPQVYKRLRNFRIEMPGEQYARATAEGLGSFGREMGQQDLAPFTLEVVPGTEGQQLRGRQTHVKSPAFESPVKSVIDLLSEEEQARFYERANKRLDARMKEYMRENGIDNDPGLIPENDFAAIANQVLAEELNATKEAAEASHGSFESWLRGVQKQQAEANKVPRLSMTQWLNIVNETSDLDELAQIEEDVQNAPKLSNERRTRVFDAIANRRRELEAGPRIMEDEEADVEEAAPETEAQPESPERAPEAPVTPRVLIDEELQQEADQEPPPPSQVAKPGTPREVPRLNRGHWLKLVKEAENQEELEMIANDLERGSENITDKSRSDVREAINERMRDLRPPIPTPGTPEWDEHVEANRPALEARAEELGTTVEEMIAKENEEANERRFGEKAREAGMTVPEYIAKVREENAQRAAESNEEMRRKYEERQARIAAEPEEDIKPAPDVVEEEAEPEYVYTPEQAERIDELKSDMNEAWAKANEAEFESKEQEKWLEKFAALEREYNEIQAAARKPVKKKKKKAKPKAEAAPEVAPEAPERQPREELREPSMVNAKDYKDIIREATTVDELKDVIKHHNDSVKAGKRKPAPSVIKKAKDKIKSIESEAPAETEAAVEELPEEERSHFYNALPPGSKQHGTTNVEDVESILNKGLNDGTAIAGREWSSESPIVLEIPDAERGEFVAHNRYYKSKPTKKGKKKPRPAAVIVDETNFNDKGWRHALPILQRLEKKYPNTLFIVVRPDGKKVAPSQISLEDRTEALDSMEERAKKLYAEREKKGTTKERKAEIDRELSRIADSAQVLAEEEIAEDKKTAAKKPARRSSAKDLKDKIKAARTEEEVQAVLDRHDEEVKAGLRKKLPSLFTEAKKRRAKIAEDAAKEEAKPTVAKTPKKSRFAALANDEIDARVAKLRQDEKGIQEEIKAEEDEDARQSLEEELEMVRREIDQYQQEIDERTAGGVGRRVQKTTTEQRKKETAEEAAKRYKDLKRQQANMDAEMDQLLAALRRAEESGDPDAVDEALAKVHRLQNDIAEVIGQAELINQKKLDAAAKKAQREARRKAGLVKTKKKTVTREKIPWYKTDEGDYLTSIGQAVAGIAEDIKRAWFRENGIWNLIDPTFIDHVIAEMKRDGVKVPSKKKILAELGADVDNSKAVHKYLDSQTEGAISLNDAGVTPNAFLDWLRTEQRKAQDSAPQRKEVVEALDEQRKAAWREARGKDEVVRTIDEEPEEETASEEKAKKEEADTERDVDEILREAERTVNEAEQQAEELKLRGEVEKMGRTTPANVSELSHMPYGRVENELNTTQNLETPVQDEKNVNPEEARALAMMRQAIKDKIELFAAEARELIGEIARISALPEKDSIDMEVIEQFNDSVDWYVKKIEEYMNAHDNLRLVRPKEGSFMEKLSDFALKNGVMLVIYDAGQFDVPFGAIATPGLIVLDSREISDKAVLAQNVVHELLHNMKRTMPDAWNTLAKRIQKLFPKTIDNIREWIISEYRSADENGQVVDPDDDVVLNEVISYVSSYRAEIILDALMYIADGKTIQDKTAWNQIKGFIKGWFRKFQDAMGWNNEDFKSFLLEKAEGDIGSGVDLIAEYVRAMRKAIGPERIDYGSSEWLASSAFDRAVETASMPANQPANPVIYNATNRSVRFMFGKRNAENADKGNPDLNPGYFKRRMTRRWRRTKQRWSGHRNVGREFYAVFVKKAREISASRYRARAARQRIQLMLLKLSRTHNKEIVGKALTQVLDGRMPLSQFQRVFNLKNNDDIMVQLNKLMDDKKKVQEMLATTGLPMGLRQLIRDSDFYATRFYAVHLLGQKYTPRQAEYNKAVEHMKAVFTEGFEKFIEKVHNENTSSMPFSVSEYLEADIAGREVMRSQVSKSKSQTLVTLGKNWDFWQRIASPTALMEGSEDILSHNELTNLAREAIDNYLDAARSGVDSVHGPLQNMPVANLVKRRLDETFRQLYGEITDPAERHARTMEVQGELLAQHVMFATMFKEGNNRWWSGPGGGRFNQYLGESEGRVTDKDRKIYGKMAGKYVTKEVYDLLHGTGALARGMSMKGIGPWFQELQGIVRGTRLLWYKTILRNGLTSVTGFAFRSGDALHTPYWKHLKDGIKLAGQILNQIRREGSYEGLSLREGTFEELDAWDKLAHLVETDIFDSSHQSMLMAVAENLEAAQGFDVAGREKAIGPLRRSLRRAMEAYSIIDLPAKYASYMNAITPKDEGGLGLSHEEAVEHVRKFYQYRDRAPEGIKRINRWWLGDYFGYTYDSGRITVNELKNVYEQARKGNIKPLLGFMIGSGLPLFRIGMGSWTSLAIGNSLTAALKAWYDDDDEEEFIRGATEEEAAVLRHYVPGYDMFSPLALWYVRNKKTGEEGVHWDVMAGQSAFPLEDAVIGTIQTWRQLKAAGMPQEFGQILLANLARILPLTPGMTLEEVILKPLFGYDISTGESSGRAGVLEVLVDAKEAVELGKPFRPGIYDAMIGDDLRGAIPTMIANSIMPGQSGKVVQSTLGYLKDNRPPRIGSGKYRYVDEPGDIWNMVASLQRSYTLWPDQMMSMLDNSIRYDLKSLGQAKYMAGAVERDQLQYHGPTPPSIVERAERGKDHWYISLKSIEREVKNFKKFSRNQFTDEQLTDYIRGIAGERGALRRYEAEAVVKGTVDSLGYEQEDAFKTEPTPKPAQKGESFAIAYLKEHRGSADYDELRRAMIARGYIIPEGRRFTLWMRDLRRQMAQEEYDLPPRRRR